MKATIDHHTYLNQHPDAWLIVPAGTCGGGHDQPAWPACHRTASWQIQPWATPTTYGYCPEHAARRLHAAALLKGNQ